MITCTATTLLYAFRFFLINSEVTLGEEPSEALVIFDNAILFH